MKKSQKSEKKILLLTLNNSSCFEKNTGVGEKGNSCLPVTLVNFIPWKSWNVYILTFLIT